MTAQVSDSVGYLGASHSIAGIKGSGLFDPSAHGLLPAPKCTACWRGFVCRYEVRDGLLLLDALDLFMDGEPPELFGARPRKPKEGMAFDAAYAKLAHPVEFTGGILLAKDFIPELYVHMGFHPAWKYEVVHELLFDKGRLTQAEDRSARMAEFREAMKGRPLGPDREEPERIRSWIQRCFSLDYTS